MVTEYYEPVELTKRAMKRARMSWSTEHLSTLDKDLKLITKLSKLGPAHNAALRQASVYFNLTASRSFWAEFDKHKAGVEMYSESTMHTLKRKPLSQDNFYRGIVDNNVLERLNSLIKDKAELVQIKCRLPEGFLQTRAISASYPALQNIYKLRIDHKWPEWKEFLEELLKLVEYPGLITCLAEL